jgi:hypothetical protein
MISRALLRASLTGKTITLGFVAPGTLWATLRCSGGMSSLRFLEA